MDAIRDFPTPTSTTDIRSWFGLVNQVANYAQLRDIMAPFKPFLSPRCRFKWTPELERAFQASKESIIAEIRHGVEIFDPAKRTCIRTDWSRQGIGYFLSQKHCSCDSYLTAVQVVGGSRWPAPDSWRQPNNVMRRSKVKPSPWLGDSNSLSTSHRGATTCWSSQTTHHWSKS